MRRSPSTKKSYFTELSTYALESLRENAEFVLYQLNRGAPLISDPSEKQRVAEMNLRAGRKAKASMAYAAASAYLSVGVALLDPGEWERSQNSCSAFGYCARNASSCAENLTRRKGSLSELVERAVSKAEKADAYCLRTDLHIMKSAYHETVGSALECLRLFGIEMSTHRARKQ